MNTIKKIFGLVSIILLSSSFTIGQYDLLPFYDMDNGNKVISVDMESYNNKAYVIYSTLLDPTVKCKFWEEDKWNDFGNFPKADCRGFINLEFINDTAYALVRGVTGWTMYYKGGNAANWDVLGEKDFAKTSELFEPKISYLQKLTVMDRNKMESKFASYSFSDGAFKKGAPARYPYFIFDNDYLIANNDSSFCLALTVEKPHGFVSIMHTYGKEVSGVEETEVKGISQKKVKKVEALYSFKNEFYIFYTDFKDKMNACKLNSSKLKWEPIKLKWEPLVMKKSKDSKFYFAEDLYFITVDQYGGVTFLERKAKWEKWSSYICGVNIGDASAPVIYINTEDDHYLLYTDMSGNMIVRNNGK